MGGEGLRRATSRSCAIMGNGKYTAYEQACHNADQKPHDENCQESAHCLDLSILSQFYLNHRAILTHVKLRLMVSLVWPGLAGLSLLSPAVILGQDRPAATTTVVFQARCHRRIGYKHKQFVPGRSHETTCEYLSGLPRHRESHSI